MERQGNYHRDSKSTERENNYPGRRRSYSRAGSYGLPYHEGHSGVHEGQSNIHEVEPGTTPVSQAEPHYLSLGSMYHPYYKKHYDEEGLRYSCHGDHEGLESGYCQEPDPLRDYSPDYRRKHYHEYRNYGSPRENRPIHSYYEDADYPLKEKYYQEDPYQFPSRPLYDYHGKPLYKGSEYSREYYAPTSASMSRHPGPDRPGYAHGGKILHEANCHKHPEDTSHNEEYRKRRDFDHNYRPEYYPRPDKKPIHDHGNYPHHYREFHAQKIETVGNSSYNNANHFTEPSFEALKEFDMNYHGDKRIAQDSLGYSNWREQSPRHSQSEKAHQDNSTLEGRHTPLKTPENVAEKSRAKVRDQSYDYPNHTKTNEPFRIKPFTSSALSDFKPRVHDYTIHPVEPVIDIESESLHSSRLNTPENLRRELDKSEHNWTSQGLKSAFSSIESSRPPSRTSTNSVGYSAVSVKPAFSIEMLEQMLNDEKEKEKEMRSLHKENLKHIKAEEVPSNLPPAEEPPSIMDDIIEENIEASYSLAKPRKKLRKSAEHISRNNSISEPQLDSGERQEMAASDLVKREMTAQEIATQESVIVDIDDEPELLNQDQEVDIDVEKEEITTVIRKKKRKKFHREVLPRDTLSKKDSPNINIMDDVLNDGQEHEDSIGVMDLMGSYHVFDLFGFIKENEANFAREFYLKQREGLEHAYCNRLAKPLALQTSFPSSEEYLKALEIPDASLFKIQKYLGSYMKKEILFKNLFLQEYRSIQRCYLTSKNSSDENLNASKHAEDTSGGDRALLKEIQSRSSRYQQGGPTDVVYSEEEYQRVILELLESERSDLSQRWKNTVANVLPMLTRTTHWYDGNFIDTDSLGRFLSTSQLQQHAFKAAGITYNSTNISSCVPLICCSTGNRPFTKEEINIYMEKYLHFPKRFDIIWKALPGRTYGEIVQYYYENKKKHQWKKWLRINSYAASAASLSAYSLGNIRKETNVKKDLNIAPEVTVEKQPANSVRRESSFAASTPRRPVGRPPASSQSVPNLPVAEPKTVSDPETAQESRAVNEPLFGHVLEKRVSNAKELKGENIRMEEQPMGSTSSLEETDDCPKGFDPIVLKVHHRELFTLKKHQHRPLLKMESMNAISETSARNPDSGSTNSNVPEYIVPSVDRSIIAFWTPIERQLLTSAFIEYGRNWDKILGKLENFRKNRGLIPINSKFESGMQSLALGKPSGQRRMSRFGDITVVTMSKMFNRIMNPENDPKEYIAKNPEPEEGENGLKNTKSGADRVIILNTIEEVKLFYELYKGLYRLNELSLHSTSPIPLDKRKRKLEKKNGAHQNITSERKRKRANECSTDKSESYKPLSLPPLLLPKKVVLPSMLHHQGPLGSLPLGAFPTLTAAAHPIMLSNPAQNRVFASVNMSHINSNHVTVPNLLLNTDSVSHASSEADPQSVSGAIGIPASIVGLQLDNNAVFSAPNLGLPGSPTSMVERVHDFLSLKGGPYTAHYAPFHAGNLHTAVLSPSGNAVSNALFSVHQSQFPLNLGTNMTIPGAFQNTLSLLNTSLSSIHSLVSSPITHSYPLIAPKPPTPSPNKTELRRESETTSELLRTFDLLKPNSNSSRKGSDSFLTSSRKASLPSSPLTAAKNSPKFDRLKSPLPESHKISSNTLLDPIQVHKIKSATNPPYIDTSNEANAEPPPKENTSFSNP